MYLLLRMGFFGVLLFFITSFIAQAQQTEAQIAAGYNQSMVLTEKGELYTFGAGYFGSTGQDIKRIDIPGLAERSLLNGQKIVDLAIDEDGSAAIILLADGRMLGVGENDFSQLGGGAINYLNMAEISRPTLDTLNIVDVEMGDRTTYFITDSGKVYTSGSNANGHIGTGTNTDPIAKPTLVTGISDKKVKSVSTSTLHTFLHMENGEIWAFGRNSNGELGIGSTVSQDIPVRIDHIFPATGDSLVKAVAGNGLSLFLTDSGKVYSAGFKNSALGFDPSPAGDIRTPQLIDQTNISSKKIVDIALRDLDADFTALLLASDGTIYSFRGNSSYEIGRSKGSQLIAGQITGPSVAGKTVVDIYPSNSGFMYFKTNDDSIWVFGGNASDKSLRYLDMPSGTGRGPAAEVYPRVLDYTQMEGRAVSKIFSSQYRTYVITKDSLLYTFGNNSSYPKEMLLRKATSEVATPTLLSKSKLGGYAAKKIFAGGRQSFVLNSNNELYAFGKNSQGELAIKDSMDKYQPVKLDASMYGHKTIEDIVVGYRDSVNVTFILTEDGSVYGYGNNYYGQLGLGNNSFQDKPAQLTHSNLSGKKIIHVATNGYSSLLVADDGTAFTFGYGANGFLGHGGSSNLNVPTALTHNTVASEKIIYGSVGGERKDRIFFVLVTESGKVISFGENSNGELGVGSKTDTPTPTLVSSSNISDKKIIKVASGFDGSLLLSADGEVFGFGKGRSVGFDVFTFLDYTEPTLLTSDKIDGRFSVNIAYDAEHSLILLDDGTVLTAAQDGSSTILDYNRGVNGVDDPSAPYAEHIEIPGLTTYSSPVPTTDLALHLDAGRGFTQSGDTISVWANLADSLDAHESTAAYQPKRVDSVINNQPGVLFDGTDNSLTLPSAADLGISSSDYEVFIVARSATVNSEIDFLMAGGNEQFEYHLNGSAGGRFIPTTSHYNDLGPIGEYSDTTAYLFNFRATETSSFNAVNRALSQVSANAHSSYTGDLFLGKRADATYFFNGYISEVIIYNSILSSADRGRIEDYLYAKYGLDNRINEQFTLTGTEGWRLLASPVADSSFAPLLSDLWTQGFPGSDSPDYGSPNVFTWDTTTANGDNTNWKALSRMDTTMQPGAAALVYVFSDDNYTEEGDTGFHKTLTVKGIEPLGTQDLSRYLNPNANGFALIGNPFRYDINWDAVTKNGLSNSVYVYDHNASEWKTWNGSTGSLTSGTIGAYNGFFVQTLGESATLEIPDSAKTYTAEEFLGKEVAKPNPHHFSIKVASKSGFTNKAWFQFSKSAKLTIDASDAYKLLPLSSQYVSLASVLDESAVLDINHLPLSNETLEIPLELNTTEAGAHTFSLTDTNLPESWRIELYDRETEITTPLAEDYNFTIIAGKTKKTATLNPASPPALATVIQPKKSQANPARFSLIITASTVVSNEEEMNVPDMVELAQNYPNPFNPSTNINYGLPKNAEVTLEVFDLLGRKVSTLINRETKQAGRHTVRFDAGSLASGLYLYRLKVGNTVITRKLTLIK
ncbi:T9SS type A sorting domain-containing protein [Gracilimonas mengyeensis]|uniref:Por secretion system C-terminal sorting domain-containing protein n=1 Tax=Gracilimonas mengyeensis TaxID=1302730 RepID=A0A521BVA3_9BACT|nr:T9SS type A sorting domain-containing protein [Gracilimonas mengyeensis]SMO51088.1 Por secretion system C-terminal sorting domain-containing protein [Gracilimonas mengyeensis]